MSDDPAIMYTLSRVPIPEFIRSTWPGVTGVVFYSDERIEVHRQIDGKEIDETWRLLPDCRTFQIITRLERPMNSEFDDAIYSGPYVSSEKARAEISRLAQRHGLSFAQDAGGGEFRGEVGGKPFRCRIDMGDDIEDLQKLRAAIDGNRSR
jgi:hypothetical protein